MFFNISTAFEKVWLEGIIFKFNQNGIRGNLLKLFKRWADFLKDRKKRVVLNGQVSNWTDVTAGVPQRSMLRPVLFLIYMNDLATGLSSDDKLFADDTHLFSAAHDINTSGNELNNDLA